MFINFNDALVMIAGVGIPSGVTGMTSVLNGLPVTKYSTSSAGVCSVASGDAPAMLMPGIVDVNVEPMT